VRNNKVTVGHSFINSDTLTLEYYNFDISGNVITQLETAASAAIYVYSASAGVSISVSENTITGYYGIYLRNFSASQVVNNSLMIGHATVAGAGVNGIYVYHLDTSSVNGNKIQVIAGNIATSVRGIATQQLLGCTINDNIIEDVYYGIYDTHAAVSSKLIIKGNIIKAYSNGAGAGGVGILTWGDDILIADNNIYAEANGIGCGPDTGADRVKISDNLIELVTINAGILAPYNIGYGGGCGISVAEGSDDITIENCTVKFRGFLAGLGPILASSTAICIRRCDNVFINGCTTKVSCNAVAGAGFAAHIWLALPGTSAQFSVTNCKIDNRTSAANPSTVNGIYVSDTTGTGHNTVGRVAGNMIDGSNNSLGPGGPPYELFVDSLFVPGGVVPSTAALITVSNNDVYDVTVAGLNLPTYFIGANVITHGDNYIINGVGANVPV
jgi:hypothetical protein